MNTRLARPGGSAWYIAEEKYSNIIVAENTLVETTSTGCPSRAENTTRMGSDATASRKPMPWLTALAISSDSVCGRSAWAAAVARSCAFIDPFVMANFVLAKAGIKPSDVSIIGVGAASGAVAAMRAGQIDAISNLDPVITLLQRSGDLKIISDTRIVAEADRVFGGPMPAGCLYAPQAFIDKNPATTQALANAMVRADKWIQAAGPADIIKAVPESYLLGDRAVYIDAFLASKGALSPDGSIPESGAATALRALQSIDESLKGVKFDLAAAWTNDFVKRANQKYPKA